MRNITVVLFILAAVGLGAVGVPQSGVGAQTQPLSVETEALVSGYSELRAGYGFDGNPERVRELLRDTAAAQRAQEVGMPLTSEEFDEFVRRQAFGIDIDEVVDWAREQPGYASERIAHDRGGGLILYGTSDFDFAAMPSRFGALDDPVYFELVQHDLATLETAAEDLTEMMKAGELSGVHAVSIRSRSPACGTPSSPQS